VILTTCVHTHTRARARARAGGARVDLRPLSCNYPAGRERIAKSSITMDICCKL